MKIKNIVKYVGSGAAVLAANSASAAIDVTAATTAITTDGTAAITAVGGALIGLAGIAVVFKWVKGAIFG
jgi:uncharacterized membrane protein